MKLKKRVYGLQNRQNSDLKEVIADGSEEQKTVKIDSVPNLYLLKKRAL